MYKINSKILLRLKEHALIHQVILNTLLTRNYFIHELEKLVGVKAEILHKVRNGLEQLEEEAALKLINLFYEVTN